MKVSILNTTPDPIATISIAARNCYNSIDKMSGREEDELKFIKGLMQKGHDGPLEHCLITFKIEKVSRALMAQLTRHRLASFCIQSQRYVNYGRNTYIEDTDYIIPPKIKENKKLEKEFKEFLNNCAKEYCKLIANDIKPEDARMVLPQCFLTDIIMSVNFRELRHIYTLRSDKRAQWEIQLLMEQIKLQLIKHKLYWIIEDLIKL